MSEAAARKMLREKLAPVARMTRIEDSLSKGVPDFAYTIRLPSMATGVSGWIEVKFAPSWPRLTISPLRLRHLTLDQVTWLEAERDAGGRAYLFLQVASEYFLLNATGARSLLVGATHAEVRAASLARGSWGLFPLREVVRALAGRSV